MTCCSRVLHCIAGWLTFLCCEACQHDQHLSTSQRGAGSAALGGIASAINVFMFEDATLERAGLLQSHQSKSVPPFLVVASNDLNQVNLSLLQSCIVVWQPEQEVVNLVHHTLGTKGTRRGVVAVFLCMI